MRFLLTSLSLLCLFLSSCTPGTDPDGTSSDRRLICYELVVERTTLHDSVVSVQMWGVAHDPPVQARHLWTSTWGARVEQMSVAGLRLEEQGSARLAGFRYYGSLERDWPDTRFPSSGEPIEWSVSSATTRLPDFTGVITVPRTSLDPTISGTGLRNDTIVADEPIRISWNRADGSSTTTDHFDVVPISDNREEALFDLIDEKDDEPATTTHVIPADSLAVWRAASSRRIVINLIRVHHVDYTHDLGQTWSRLVFREVERRSVWF